MHVVPRPWSVVLSDGPTVEIATGWTVRTTPELADVVRRFVSDVASDLSLEVEVVAALPFDTHGTSGQRTVDVWIDAAASLPDVVARGLSPTGDPVDERSRLVIGDDRVTVTAASVAGIRHALTTLRQLLSTSPRSQQGDGVLLAAAEILDAPRIAWRGLSLDVVRCFVALDEVRRIVDLLALYKLNVLHLHLSDDQGWRLEIPHRPALTEVGGRRAARGRPGGWYSVEDVASLCRYAADRGVTIVPEIDMPGHSAAAIRALPELAPDGGSLLLPDRDGVLDFAADVVHALAAAAPGPFVHVGGDEAWGMDHDAYARFVDEVRRMVAATGKRMITWQEGARSDIGPDDIVQHWMRFDPALEAAIDAGEVADEHLPAETTMPREMVAAMIDMFRTGRRDLGRALERGAQVILSPADRLYLDKPYAEPATDPAHEERRGRVGLRVYTPATIEESFDWDPADTIPGGLDHVVGVEAAVWCETVETMEDLEFLLLPRLPGVAERAWSPSGSTWPEYRVRLGAQSRTWRRDGWTWCSSSLVDWS